MNRIPLDTAHPSSLLRERAHTLIHGPQTGTRAPNDGRLALRVLFDLACAPETASDALALLHELQVHQVELELQYEELQSSRAELESAWSRQARLHDASPGAQLVLDTAGHLLECNASALTYFDESLPKIHGQALTSWLVPADRPRAQSWLLQAQRSDQAISMGLTLNSQNPTGRQVCAAARANPLAPGVLVVWVDAPSPV